MAESPTGSERLAELFERALDIAPDHRQIWLTKACGEDTVLREKLARLLRADAREAGILDTPPPLLAEAILSGNRAPDASTRTLGPYTVLRSLGVGGMGEVWLAERSDGEFEQRVAIKQLAYPTPGLLQRFRQERQILARLEHPNIAHLLDGGVDVQGAPYLVMEYVDGVPVTDHVRTHELDLPSRLRLFLRVCEAVQYAHQNLIVHRDLKPSNIFVTADGTPKLLDFGIAKVLATTGDDAPTQTHARMLSPDYAAPEQFSGAAITTATDVYALGVVLYEILTDARAPRLTAGNGAPAVPFATSIPPPSAAVDRATGSARRRALRGDLDRITLTALAAEPQRRYPSAEALASDIRRYLTGRPIAARGDNALYRLRKFARRNRWAVAAAALVFVVCIAATFVSLHEARLARAQANRAQAVRTFLLGVFAQASPDENKSRAITAHELLDKAAMQLTQNASDSPEVTADLSAVIAGLYIDIGDYDRAQSLLDANIDARIRDVPAAIRLRSLVSLADIAERRGILPAARKYLAQGLLLANSSAVDPVDLSELRRRRASIEVASDPKVAEPLARAALAYDVAQFGDPSEQVEQDWDTLGRLLRNLSRNDEAVAAATKALAIARALHGNEHTQVSDKLNSLGVTLKITGDYPRAVRAHEEALAISTRIKGADHPDTLQMQANLLSAMQSDGQYRRTVPILQDNLARTRKVLGDNDQRVAWAESSLAMSWKNIGEFANADAAYTECERIWTTIAGPDSAEGLSTQINHGLLLGLEGRHAQAEVILRNALRVARVRFPEASREVRFARFRLASMLTHTGKSTEAITLVEPLLDVPAPTNDSERYILASSQMAFAQASLNLDRANEAGISAQSALELMKMRHPPDHANVGKALLLVGRIEAAQHQNVAAEADLRNAVATLVQEEAADADPTLADARIILAEILSAAGKHEEVRTIINGLHAPLAGDEYPYKTAFRARVQKLSNDLPGGRR